MPRPCRRGAAVRIGLPTRDVTPESRDESGVNDGPRQTGRIVRSPSVITAFLGRHELDPWMVSPAGWVGSEPSPDWEDWGAVASILDERAVGVTSLGDAQSVFVPVLGRTFEGAVGDVGGAAVADPFVDVIDLATRRAHRTTDVLTTVDHQFERFSSASLNKRRLRPKSVTTP